MKTSTRFTCFLVGFVVAVAGRSQSAAGDRHNLAPNGVLGENYAELSYGLQDIRHISPNFNVVSVDGNAAITRHLDLGGGISTGWIGGTVDGHANTLSGVATAYTTWRRAKPFVSAGLGYQWLSMRGATDAWLWGSTIGVELPAIENVLVLTPRIGYADDFRRSGRSAQQWTFETEANCWLTRSTALFASVGYAEARRSPFDSWTGRIGVRMRY